jgi:transposase
MPKTPPPLEFDYQKGFEIPTKYKEAIRQLHDFASVPTGDILNRYKLARSTVKQILNYNKPEHAHITYTGRPKKLSNRQVDEIIEYCSES